MKDTEEKEEKQGKGKLYCFVGVSPKGYRGCSYWYLDEEGKSRQGGYVWVRMGKRNREQVVYVDCVRYCTESDAPYDLNSVKRVVRQATKEQFDTEIQAWEF